MPAVAAASARRLRLEPTVELFPASDGHLYLLRGGAVSEFVIRDPSPFERGLLLALGGGEVTAPELVERLGAPADDVAASLDQLAALGLLEEPAALRDGRLTAEERERFDRQLPYLAANAPAGLDAPALQARLTHARVVVLGCGGLGSWALAGLACAGVGTLVLVDDDTVELSNLNRQLLYRRSDVGRPKVEAAAEALEAFNPGAQIEPLPRRVASRADVEAIVRGADALVQTADWPPYELERWVDEACHAQGVPHVSAAQAPPLIRVGPFVMPGDTACFACQEEASRRDFPLYDELVEFRRRHALPAATLGPASGVVGSLIAMEVMHALTGIAPPATAGRALLFDLRTAELRFEAIPRDPDCPRCG